MGGNTRFQFRVKVTTLQEFYDLVKETNLTNEGLILEMMKTFKKKRPKIKSKQ